jgi:hypothetical protein
MDDIMKRNGKIASLPSHIWSVMMDGEESHCATECTQSLIADGFIIGKRVFQALTQHVGVQRESRRPPRATGRVVFCCFISQIELRSAVAPLQTSIAKNSRLMGQFYHQIESSVIKM